MGTWTFWSFFAGSVCSIVLELSSTHGASSLSSLLIANMSIHPWTHTAIIPHIPVAEINAAVERGRQVALDMAVRAGIKVAELSIGVCTDALLNSEDH